MLVHLQTCLQIVDMGVIKNAPGREEPKTFNEAFKQARLDLGANQIFEFQGRKYGTNLAGEKFTPSAEVLKVHFGSDTAAIQKRLEEENRRMESPYTSKNTVKVEPDWKDWKEIKKDNLEFNKMDQASRIVQYKKQNPTGKNYAIVDKKKGLVHLYEEGKDEPIYTAAVDLGARKSDAQTVTKYKDQNKDGKITDADKVGGKFQVDWSAGNLSTGAGKFFISNIDKKGYGGLPILNMMNEKQYEQFKKTGKVENVATSFHKGYIADDDARVSNGCIRCNKPTLDKVSNHLSNASEVYILPEDEGNEFVLENGKLNFKVRSGKDYNSYTDSQGRSQKGQGINRGQNTLNYRPIKIGLNEEEFKKNVFQWNDFNDKKELEQTTKPYLRALADNKQRVMKSVGISGDVYNDVAKVAFGIYGTESNYGDTHSFVGNAMRAVKKAVNPKGSSSPDYKSKAGLYGANKPWNSVGLTQIRTSYLSDKEKSVISELGIKSNKDFLDPEKAAVATAAILGVRYNEQLTTEQKKDMVKYLPKTWNRRENYADRVQKNSRFMTMEEYTKPVRKMEDGGALSGLSGMAGGVADLVAPGSGAIVSPLWDLLEGVIDSRVGGNKLKLKPTKSLYELGGELEGELGPGMAQYKGMSHKNGGIMVTKSGVPSSAPTEDNVEGEEVLVNLGKMGTHIFSKRLKIK